MGLGIGITGFRQRNIPNLRPTVCRLRRNDVKESVENQIFSYNGSWPENGTIQLHACCDFYYSVRFVEFYCTLSTLVTTNITDSFSKHEQFSILLQ
nr:unnamed protein product [Fasciola hepatica]